MSKPSIGRGHPSAPSNLGARPKGYHPREASGGVFNLFSPAQIKQFRECFNLIDTDGDGKIGVEDLRQTLGNLGQIPSDRLLTTLLSSRPGDTDPDLSHATLSGSPDSPTFPSSTSSDPLRATLTFTQFLTLFGERLVALDGEDELLEAFSSFEMPGGEAGCVDVKEMRGWLREYGDKMSDEEIDRLFRGPFTDRAGKTFNYVDFAKSLKVNADGEMKEDALRA